MAQVLLDWKTTDKLMQSIPSKLQIATLNSLHIRADVKLGLDLLTCMLKLLK